MASSCWAPVVRAFPAAIGVRALTSAKSEATKNIGEYITETAEISVTGTGTACAEIRIYACMTELVIA